MLIYDADIINYDICIAFAESQETPSHMIYIIKHFNPKKKLVLSDVSALFTCCGAPPTSFFLGLTMFINHMILITLCIPHT